MNARIPDETTVRAALERAGRAPSLHNSQPWRWRWHGTTVALHVDTTRVLPATDAFARQGVLACGVVLHHATAAFAALGLQVRIDRFPEPTDRRHVASLEFRDRREPTEGELDLAAAIDRRYTDRAPFAALDRWPYLFPVLESACRAFWTTPTPIGDDLREELDRLSWISAATRQRDPAYQIEAREWLGGSAPGSGIPAAALPSAQDAGRVPINRRFPAGTADAGCEEQDRAQLLLLSTPDDTPESLLSCGEALSTVLLECTRHGASTCVLTHLTELPGTRSQVRLLTRTRSPQVFVRVGVATAPPPPRTPRRPVEDVLEVG
ncbi:Acg family FMN-binding oxidoreductase [Nocardia higoensis]|uniref:Acg family FMN-binding oxidoreductase n=1 Tax=Nocardia higoensis TaxID=228599 RepID=UPI000300282B|nr:hypothetical protein [Nocardia higoensis]